MFNGSLELKSTNFILKNHGIQPGGPVQKVIDSETMRYMGPYMPRRQAGELEHMMVLSTVIGSGQIDIPGPYAHYLHEGICLRRQAAPGQRRMKLKYRRSES